MSIIGVGVAIGGAGVVTGGAGVAIGNLMNPLLKTLALAKMVFGRI